MRAAGSGTFRETSRSAADDVVMASLSTAGSPRGEEGLSKVNESAFAVTFFSALERCNPGSSITIVTGS